MAHDVFISYPHQSKAVADAACAKLENQGIRCWIAPRDVPPGAEWAGSIVDAIDSCRVMVLIFSEYSNRSKQVHREVQRAFDGEKPVIPFRIENIMPEKSLAYYMGSVHWLDALTPPIEAHLEKLVDSIGALIGVPCGKSPLQPDHGTPKTLDTEQTGRIRIDAKILHGVVDALFQPGAGKFEWFKDLDFGPEMVVVPAGDFMMGYCGPDPVNVGQPLHKVNVVQSLAVGRHAVTRGQFAAFVNNTDYKIERGAYVDAEPNRDAWWRNPGFEQDDNHPVVCINWEDARAYAKWLSESTSKTYRLLAEAEWEYMARAGTTTPFWWGPLIATNLANYNGEQRYNSKELWEGGGGLGLYRKSTVPVDSFSANPWGIYNVHGNVNEWCEDVYHRDYNGAPANGSAWLLGDIGQRMARGGSWWDSPGNLRSASRSGYPSVWRGSALAFRIARKLDGGDEF